LRSTTGLLARASAGLADPVNDEQGRKYPSNPLIQEGERKSHLALITYKKADEVGSFEQNQSTNPYFEYMTGVPSWQWRYS